MSDLDAPTAGDAGDFVAKWRGAWPEWALVEGFLPAAQRPCIDAWQALQFEWQEAAWRGDPRPGDLKLQWWMEELDGWAQGRRRHPLGSVLMKQAVPWRALATALPSLSSTRGRPRDVREAWASLEPVATEIAGVESALFGGASEPAAVTAAWLHARLARHPDDAVPQDLAPVPGADPADGWRRALLSDWPRLRGLTPSRGMVLALARARLARGAAAKPLPPLSALWAGWRGARG